MRCRLGNDFQVRGCYWTNQHQFLRAFKCPEKRLDSSTGLALTIRNKAAQDSISNLMLDQRELRFYLL